jgi:hypothetical protein
MSRPISKSTINETIAAFAEKTPAGRSITAVGRGKTVYGKKI